jgi:hypothetical protein
MRVIGRGATIADALDAALASGAVEDGTIPAPHFRAERNEVSCRGEVVATCKSRTFASRVANALNVYQPNERMM